MTCFNLASSCGFKYKHRESTGFPCHFPAWALNSVTCLSSSQYIWHKAILIYILFASLPFWKLAMTASYPHLHVPSSSGEMEFLSGAWDHPEWMLHFPLPFAAKCGQVIIFWSMGCKWKCGIAPSRIPYFPSLPPSCCLECACEGWSSSCHLGPEENELTLVMAKPDGAWISRYLKHSHHTARMILWTCTSEGVACIVSIP